MKKLLFQLDTDVIANTFDTVVAYDGGADHVTVHGGITPKTVGKMVDGVIFTRAPKKKKNSALFITGSDMREGQAVFDAVLNHFFDDFRVSVMLDSNGSNTTAAAAVAFARQHMDLAGKKAVILAGTGPVGQRAGVMLAKEGADVVITSRRVERAEVACEAMARTFGVELNAAAGSDRETFDEVLKDAHFVFATGAAGVQILNEDQWKSLPNLEVIIDANATPPLGINGINMTDRGAERHGKICYGALGFGGLKLEIHRECVARLFKTNDNVFDALQIFELAKEMTSA
ncbi:MAG: methylene-tetrahydromethanopterin dehydrogenase N-terminal domain-containing protein [Pseudomonadota bacterium]